MKENNGEQQRDGHLIPAPFLLYKRKTYLKAENPKYPPVDVTGRTDYEIWGVVTHVVHKLTRSKGNET